MIVRNRVGTIPTGKFMIFDGNTEIAGSMEPLSGIIVRNGNLVVKGSLQYRAMMRAQCLILVENGDVHIKEDVCRGSIVASGSITVDGKCFNAYLEGTIVSVNSDDSTINPTDKPYDIKEPNLKKPALGLSDLELKKEYYFMHHADKFLSYLEILRPYLSQQRRKAKHEQHELELALAASLVEEKKSFERKDVKIPDSHSQIALKLHGKPSASEEKSALAMADDNYDEMTQDYIESLQRRKPTISELLDELKLTGEEEEKLVKYQDPVHETMIKTPVRFNGKLFDLDTLLGRLGKTDPLSSKYIVKKSKIQPDWDTADELYNALKEILNGRRKMDVDKSDDVSKQADAGVVAKITSYFRFG